MSGNRSISSPDVMSLKASRVTSYHGSAMSVVMTVIALLYPSITLKRRLTVDYTDDITFVRYRRAQSLLSPGSCCPGSRSFHQPIKNKISSYQSRYNKWNSIDFTRASGFRGRLLLLGLLGMYHGQRHSNPQSLGPGSCQQTLEIVESIKSFCRL